MKFSEFKEKYKKLQTQDERENFIKNRINELLQVSSNQKIGKEQCGSYNGFISPTNEVVSNSSGLFPNLTFDDFDIYKDFLNFVENDVDKYFYGEPSTIMCVQQFVWKYFGVNSSNVFARMNVYDTPNNEPISIQKLKGINVAACSERSALVQNLLKFMGFDSEIVFGKLNSNESHAYIIFAPEKGGIKLLYDPMNPVVFQAEGKEEYGIGVSKMSNEDYIALQNGGTYKFNYDLVKKIYGKTECLEEERIYSSDSYLFNKGTRENERALPTNDSEEEQKLSNDVRRKQLEQARKLIEEQMKSNGIAYGQQDNGLSVENKTGIRR